jgi:MFS family permease
VGLGVGPVLGELALGIGGFALAWLTGLGLCLVGAILATRVPETMQGPIVSSDAPPAPLIHRAALGPGVVLLAGVAAMSAFLLLIGPHADRTGVDAWSVSFLVFGGVVVVCRVAFARLPDRVPPMRLAGAALVLAAAGLVTTAVTPGWAGLLAGTAILGVGVAFLTPAVFAAVFSVVPGPERGAAAGTVTAFIDLGFAGGPFLAGWVGASAGLPAAFAVAGFLAILGASGAFAQLRTARPEPVRLVTADRGRP